MRKLLFLLLSLFIFEIGTAQSIVSPADEMPYFAGCDYLKQGSTEKRNCSNENLIAYISDKLEYPEAAQASALEGAVYVSFEVDKDGTVQHPKVIRDLGEGCGEEAIRVIQSMPKWEPALKSGAPVAVKLNLKVQFSLEDDDEDVADNFKIIWGLIRGDQIQKENLINNLQYPITVRDQFGNPFNINELSFIYSRNDKVKEVKSNGQLTNEQKQMLRKIKKGGSLSISAIVQKDGQFINVGRDFDILEF